MLHPKYRPDIDGLRAVAVLAVVVFHAFPEAMRGGFIGVDVFFVISGYLISTIIFNNLDRGTFSFGDFYARRVKRIFPALIIVLAFSYTAGWFLMLADEYKQLGRHIAAGSGFVSNFAFWGEAGYFDNSADNKPLLHLWSLGIEEQFYIIWPLLVWAVWKRNFRIIIVTAVVAAGSFFLNIFSIKYDAVATFYSPQTRFWELLCGAFLAWSALYKSDVIELVKTKLNSWLNLALRRKSPVVDGKTLSDTSSVIGLLLLVFGFWYLNKDLAFPGKWALVPVLGAVLLISAGSSAIVNRTILSRKIVVWFGLISFPLYLWHWPLLSFARIFEGGLPPVGVRILAIALSIFLAWVTYKIVENPVRTSGHGTAKVTILVAFMVVVGFAGYDVYNRDGYESRLYHKKFESYANSIKVTPRAGECFEIPYAYKKDGDWFCNLGEKSQPVKFFAHGDSHALGLLPALENFAKDHAVNIQFTGASGCPSLLGIQSMRGEIGIEKFNCKELNERVFRHVRNSGIKSVILINRWVYYTESKSRPNEFNPVARNVESKINVESSSNDLLWALKYTVERYKSIGVNVVFIQDNPQQIHEPKDILRKGKGVDGLYNLYSVGYEEHVRNQERVNTAIRQQEADIVSFDSVLCDAKHCPLVRESRFLYSDDDHLSVDGANYVYPLLSKTLSKRN